jgi:hypothetical protein
MRKKATKFKRECLAKALLRRRQTSGKNRFGIGKKAESKQHAGVFYYAIIPRDLLRCPGISPQARLLYALLHSYSMQKKWEKKGSIKKIPNTIVSQKTLSEDMNCSVRSIYTWQKELSNGGWIEVKQRGFNMTNIVYLNDKKGIMRPKRNTRKC